MTLKQRALALAHLASIQDLLGVNDIGLASFLLDEAVLMAPELFRSGDGDGDGDDEEGETASINSALQIQCPPLLVKSPWLSPPPSFVRSCSTPRSNGKARSRPFSRQPPCGFEMLEVIEPTADMAVATSEIRWSRAGRLQQAWTIPGASVAGFQSRKEWRDVPIEPDAEAAPAPFIGAFGE